MNPGPFVRGSNVYSGRPPARYTIFRRSRHAQTNHHTVSGRSIIAPGAAASLDALDLNALYSDLERLEQCLATIEENLIAKLRVAASSEHLREARFALERELKPYRNKMTAEQLAMLEQHFLDRRLLESAGLPPLSLFYLS
jgi:hypothetical protein